MKKVVLKAELYDDKIKKRAMKAVSGLSGVESVSVDMKDQKMTLIGDIDPVSVVGKLRKLCYAEIVSVGPAKEEKEEKKKKEEKKPDAKKDPKEEYAELQKMYAAYYNNPNKDPKEEYAELMRIYYNQTRQPQYYPSYYYRTVEENPSGCVIC